MAVRRRTSGVSVILVGVGAGVDAVLDPGVRPVPGFQQRDLPTAGVGGERLVAVAVGDLSGLTRPDRLLCDDLADSVGDGLTDREVQPGGGERAYQGDLWSWAAVCAPGRIRTCAYASGGRRSIP